MKTILIVDDSAICREPIAAALRLKGYRTICAADGLDALAALEREKEKPALALLDISMPRMDGISLLAAMRKHPDYKSIPVILLTAVQDRDTVLRARNLGVRDYLLKSHFSLDDMLNRVKKHIDEPEPAKAPAAQPAPSKGAVVSHSPTSAAAKGPIDASSIRPLLTREQTTARVEECTTARTLAGVVAEIIAVTSSPRGAVSDVASLLKKDPLLSARVINVANSAAFVTNKAHISSVEEAVRNIGVGAVRNIVSSVGIFETFPPDAKDGFNILRCWQHSFAAAAIMEKLVGDDGPIPKGIAQLIGLCHDLGEIVLRQVFSTEFAACVEMAAKAGKSHHAVQATVFGIPHAELTTLVLSKLGLPPGICAPIREHHDLLARPSAAAPREPAARILRIADHFSHGMMLASSPESLISVFTEAERKACLGTHEIVLNEEDLRSEAMLTTSLLARLNSEETGRLAQPMFPPSQTSICYVRHPALSAIDPIASALRLMSQTEVKDHLPKTAAELGDASALIITTPTSTAKGLALAEVEMFRKACGKPMLPVLYITNSIDESRLQLPGLTVTGHPLSLSRLAHFVESLSAAHSQAA